MHLVSLYYGVHLVFMCLVARAKFADYLHPCGEKGSLLPGTRVQQLEPKECNLLCIVMWFEEPETNETAHGVQIQSLHPLTHTSNSRPTASCYVVV